jgi:hypothetical protein
MSQGSDPPQPRPECVFDDDGTRLPETLEDTRDVCSFVTTYTYRLGEMNGDAYSLGNERGRGK